MKKHVAWKSALSLLLMVLPLAGYADAQSEWGEADSPQGGEVEVSERLLTPWIQDIAITAGDQPSVACPPLYQKINVDLNSGSGGKFIYLCFTKESDWARPAGSIVSRINAVAREQEAQTESFTGGCAAFLGYGANDCIGFFAIPYGDSNGDANQGVGGDFIHIFKDVVFQTCDAYGCSFSDWYSGSRVKEITVVAGDSAAVSCPSYFEKVPVDLNKGAGGAYIYICQLLEQF